MNALRNLVSNTNTSNKIKNHTSVKKYASERGFSSSSSEEEVRFFLSSVLQNFRRAAARVHLTRVASHARTSKLWFKEQETDQVRGAQPTSSG